GLLIIRSRTIILTENSSWARGEVTWRVNVVAPGAGTPTGSVTFVDGATAIGTGTVNATGQAAFSTTSLNAGSHSITASYSGDSQFNGSSGTAAQTVNKASTSKALASSPNPAKFRPEHPVYS